MAKMFYSLDEAAQKLKVSPDDVKAMADKRQLEVFRDRDRLMFKVEQVDLLAGGKSDGREEIIPLADSGMELEPIGLASSGSGASMGSGLGMSGSGAPAGDSPKEQTGISIFDADATDESDPSAVTRVTSAPLQGLAATSAGDSSAGSGIMDLGAGTGFGQGLAEDAFGVTANAGSGSVDAEGSSAGAPEGGALFEGGGGADAAPASAGMVPMAAMVAAEPYDGVWSGVLGGVAFGAIVTLLLSVFAVVLVLSGSGADFLQMLGQNIWAVIGGLAVLTVVAGVIGMVIGKRS
ncbi:MAG: helix-turn-helix domain-containing protein [Phycisphaeraceae bacterium]|nr:helix-turn-helix domain-containing protein [Phycisphaeraceae bacterium]